MFLPPEKPVVLTVETAETGEKRDVVLTPVKTSTFRLGVTVDLSGDQPVIMEVDPSSNGNNPVLQKGDVLVSVNGVSYEQSDAFAAEVERSQGAEVTVQQMAGRCLAAPETFVSVLALLARVKPRSIAPPMLNSTKYIPGEVSPIAGTSLSLPCVQQMA